jgi:hypothetical protein
MAQLDADEAIKLQGALRRAVADQQYTEMKVINGERWPRVSVCVDQTVHRPCVWFRQSPDGPPLPVLLHPAEAQNVIDALQVAIDDRDRLRGDLDEIEALPETDD